MPTSGFVGKGYYTDKLLFGGGLTSHTISAPTAFGGSISGYANFSPSLSGDLAAKNLTIDSQLLPVFMDPGGGSPDVYRTNKIRASGTITLNPGGAIRVDGEIPNGGTSWVSASGAVGYGFQTQFKGNFSLGGSGSGGAANLTGSGGTGLPNPSTVPNSAFVALGGSGGQGGSLTATPGGPPGVCSFDYAANSYFQPSVYNDALVFYNSFISAAAGAPPTSVHPYYEIYPYKIYGGGGGGGSSDMAGMPGLGGGSAGGGVCYISCDKLVLNGGSISAKGQNGNVAGAGGGGLIIVCANDIVWTSGTSTIDVSGGTTTTTYGGANGVAGTILIFSNQLVGKYTGILTKAIFEAQLTQYQAST